MHKQQSDMRCFWDTVGRAICEQDFSIQTPDGSVPNLVIGGYLKIVAHGVEYRSIPAENGCVWVAWEPYEIIRHFSKLTDPNAMIEWVPFNRNKPGKQYS